MDLTRFTSLVLCAVLVSACSDGMWLGDDEDERLQGERYAVISAGPQLRVEPQLAQVPVSFPYADHNESWPQAGGSGRSVMEHLALDGDLTERQTARVGEGYDWEERLVPAPVVANNLVYAMDSRGYVSAHDVADIGRVSWVSKVAVLRDGEDIYGGGLAAGDGAIYAVTGQGVLAAMDASTGAEIWVRKLQLPVRSAPRLSGDVVLVVSVNNQLFALDRKDGRILWKHGGITEIAGVFGAATPAVAGEMVVVPYSSGELYALRRTSGHEVWSDMLLMPSRTTPAMVLSDIDGNPVIAHERVYALGQGGVLASIDLATGQRVWELPVSGNETPWVAGPFLFVMDGDRSLAAVHVPTGRVKWIAELPELEAGERWSGPVLAEERLLMVSSTGRLLKLSPGDGSEMEEVSIPSGVYTAPVIAQGKVFLVTRGGELVVLK